ncbi:protein-export chaperone SecB [Pseudomonadales bacterium]|jgi:preprotein translocase subunit SecB|nr:protein-export chaperone SecB [Pseudomonadales bacterium]MDB4408300.1 protein-export chaperone SecB [bacterium]MDA8789554.1 protein-export chaperone SecB [Pseudomonadales bacterium]MDA8965752.1 protein-export chaperone SecB [Pseudomonadales bacterium]MDB4090320.1 protein-export chaperone SecB [Pseudomonadales bacterium]
MAEGDNNPADSNPGGQGAEQPAGPQFGVTKTFVKDISFETPMGVKVFTQAFQPKIQLDVNSRGSAIADNTHEVVLTLTITAKIDDNTAYLLELQQAGIFAISGFEDEQLKHVLGAICPNFLFPYAREAVDSMVVRGGFPPLSLAPIDFDALFRNAQAQATEGQKLN